MRMIKFVVCVVAASAVAACSGSSGGSSSPSKPEDTVSATPTQATLANPNPGACLRLKAIISRQVEPALKGYDAKKNEFDKAVAAKLRTAGTQMSALTTLANGSTQSALQSFTTAVNDVSVAMLGGDHDGLNTALQAEKTALAGVRSVCRF